MRCISIPAIDRSCIVGFLGLGNMGFPMSVNLAQRHDLIAFDVNEKSREKAHQQGMRVAPNIEQVASKAETIITMLPSDDAVNTVMSELSKNTTSELTVIDCSTVSPSTSQYWYERLAAEGRLFVDAPVSGGVKGAELGSLTFMVGMEEEAMKCKVEPILACMGERVIACGGPGAGAAVKLCNNLALATQMAGICEAMNLGEALGVNPVTLASIMNASTAKSWSCEINNPHPMVAALSNAPASKGYDGGFGTRLMLKDLGLAVKAGSAAHVALPLGNSTRELYQLAEAHGLGDKDFGVLLQFLRGK